jgi:hypothetical protein
MRWLPLALLAFAACSGSSKYMTKNETPVPATPEPGKARIVFVRPSGFGYAVTFTVVDEKGNFVGQVPAKGHVLHSVAPGRHRFLVWAENTAVVDCEVAAGRTYYVEVASKMGMWAARGHLLPVKPGSEPWDELDEWMADTTQWSVDPKLAADWKADKSSGIAKQLQRADEMWAKYTDEEREQRTMRPGDGK